jgi:hypothetical protein
MLRCMGCRAHSECTLYTFQYCPCSDCNVFLVQTWMRVHSKVQVVKGRYYTQLPVRDPAKKITVRVRAATKGAIVGLSSSKSAAFFGESITSTLVDCFQ